MTDSDSKFSNGLFSIALAPEKLYDFADSFNPLFETLDGNDIGKELLLESHIIQAMEVADLIVEKESSKSKSLRDTISRANHPMLALDTTGKILEVNNFALNFFSIKKKTHLHQFDLTDKSKNDLLGHLNKISDNSSDNEYSFIELLELEQTETTTSHFVCITPWKLEAEQYCLIVQAVNIRWPDHMDPLLRKTFKLTKSEIAVFRLLSEGMSINDTAELRNTSVSTIRTQIREIYSKTGTKTQLQFIRLAVSLAALTFDENSASLKIDSEKAAFHSQPPFPREEHWHLLRLSDGRKLDYAIFGDPKGSPVMFFHNELLGDVWPAVLTEYATQRGLKIILPARPYYRRSSPYPKKSFHPTQTAHDFAELLNYLNIDKVAILAQTLGGMFALEFTTHYEKHVHSITTLSPMLPFTSDEQRKNMPPLHRFISTVILSSPKLIEFVARVGFAFYMKDGPERYARLTFSSCEVDQQILNQPQHMNDVCKGLKFGQANGFRPYVAGFKHLIKNPEEKMKTVNVPMSIIIGTSDNNTRLERAKGLKEIGVNLDIVLAENGGELLIFSHPELIIETVLKTF